MVLELAEQPALARDLAAGGVFVPACQLQMHEDCDLVLRGANGDELAVAATCVWADGTRGVGLQLIGFDTAMKEKIARLASGETEEEEDEEVRKAPTSQREKLRGLTLVHQLKVAQHGELGERILLERMYGKNVWDALLRNPRVTGPEVARIARMGALPRPQLELIVGNGTWLAIPEVRRALLSNTRLGTDAVLRVLRLLPCEMRPNGCSATRPEGNFALVCARCDSMDAAPISSARSRSSLAFRSMPKARR